MKRIEDWQAKVFGKSFAALIVYLQQDYNNIHIITLTRNSKEVKPHHSIIL